MRNAITLALLISPLLGATQSSTAPAASAEMKKLQPFIGNWTGKGTLNHEGQSVPFTTTAKGATSLGGKNVRLELELKGTPMGDVSSEAILSYDADKKVYRGIFLISHEATPLMSVGEFDGSKLRFKGSAPDSESIVVITFDISKADEVSMKVEADSDGTGKVSEVMSATWTKKKQN